MPIIIVEPEGSEASLNQTETDEASLKSLMKPPGLGLIPKKQKIPGSSGSGLLGAELALTTNGPQTGSSQAVSNVSYELNSVTCVST